MPTSDSRHEEPNPGRRLAASALTGAAQRFPHLDLQPLETAGLDARDARLAMAIHRSALQRWLTCRYLLDRFLKKPCRTLEPSLQAVLISGAVQLLFLHGSPPWAVVDESVELARRLVRKSAGRLVNAVLRRLADLIAERTSTEPWSPAADRLPLEEGSLRLKEAVLPDPRDAVRYLSVATSHPSNLVSAWLERLGWERTTALCQHNVLTPPLIVAMERGWSPEAERRQNEGQAGSWTAHQWPGFVIWQGSYTELQQFLAVHPARRVQDPGAARAVELSAELRPRIILDFCAGRGTKTRQLADLHPQARIIASDPDADRLTSLRELEKQLPNVTATSPEALETALAEHGADLILLDVPCSNTAVLARRPEARYRYGPKSLESLQKLQRTIAEAAGRFLAPGGWLVYATCSLEPMENQAQVAWLTTHGGLKLLKEQLTFPEGNGPTYHDGGYAALLRAR